MIITNNEIMTLAFIFYGENVFVSFEDMCRYLNHISAKVLARGDSYGVYYSFGELLDMVESNPDCFIQDGFSFKCTNINKVKDMYLKNTSKDFLDIVKQLEKSIKK